LIVFVPVATPTPLVPEVAFTTPADLASVANGAVNITGFGIDVSTVTLTTTYLGPPLAAGATFPPPTAASAAPVAHSSASASASASIGPSGSAGPQPKSAGTAADGTFALATQLDPGRWQLTIVGTTAKGIATKAVTRTINVPYKGVNLTIEVKGGDAWFKYWRDGTAIDSSTFVDGYKVSIVGTKTACVYTARPDIVFITFNGTSYGPVKTWGGQRVAFDINGPRYTASCG
jgi:hypothetical protein